MLNIIVNPASKSGKGKRIWEEVKEILEEKKIEYNIFFTEKSGDATEYASKLTAETGEFPGEAAKLTEGEGKFVREAANSTATLLVLGGDGTMNEVVQGIVDFNKIQVAYMPTGSSNDLSRSLVNKFRNENRSQNKNQTQNENKNPNKNQKLTKDHAKQGKGRTDKNKYGNKANHRIKKQLENILENEQILEMNIGKATLYDEEGTVLIRKRFIVSSGVGFDAAVCEEAQHSKIKETLNKFGLGKLTYVGIALKYLLTIRAMPCKITLDESEELSLNRFLFVACMNHPYEGGGFKFCPKADSTDGWLDLCILGEMAKWKMFFALPAAYKGKHVGFSDVCIKRAKRVSVTLEAPLFVHTDGEVPGMASKIEWELLDSKLRMIQ